MGVLEVFLGENKFLDENKLKVNFLDLEV